jgi:type I restriction enzyme S subunit
VSLSLKAYPEYKDTGQSWIGSVPRHWDVLPNRALFNERIAKNHPDEQMLSVTIKSGVIRQQDLLRSSSKKDSSNEDKSKYKLVIRGDIAYNKMRAWQGAVGASPYRGIVSPAYIVQTLRTSDNPDFFHYLLRTPAFAKEAERWSYGITSDQWSLRSSDFKQIYCQRPPRPEQDSIVRFLKHREGPTNRLIRAKRRFIEVLHEQERVIIHRGVTRGLDPNSATTPSRTSFWGDVPKHWNVTKLYRVTDPNRPVMYGIVLPGPNVDEGVFIVKGGNCEPGRLRAEFLSRTTFEIESHYVRSRLRANDIVYSIRGSIGSAELVPEELEGANLTQDAARIAPREGIHPIWLLYALRSYAFFAKLDAGAIGATIRGINIRDLKRAELVVPPLPEQVEIAEHLDRELSGIKDLLVRTHRELQLVAEYRTRLIADVVTGKLDVREVQLPASEQEAEPTENTENLDMDEFPEGGIPDSDEVPA